jgi:hypothetical protein
VLLATGGKLMGKLVTARYVGHIHLPILGTWGACYVSSAMSGLRTGFSQKYTHRMGIHKARKDKLPVSKADQVLLE